MVVPSASPISWPDHCLAASTLQEPTLRVSSSAR